MSAMVMREEVRMYDAFPDALCAAAIRLQVRDCSPEHLVLLGPLMLV